MLSLITYSSLMSKYTRSVLIVPFNELVFTLVIDFTLSASTQVYAESGASKITPTITN